MMQWTPFDVTPYEYRKRVAQALRRAEIAKAADTVAADHRRGAHPGRATAALGIVGALGMAIGWMIG